VAVLGLDSREVDVPVVGGHASVTILPLLSQIKHPCSFTSEEASYLTSHIQNDGTKVVKYVVRLQNCPLLHQR
nr:malate dehydrogenase, glyoxysomal [Tanacetum cinerariifolium]